MPVLVAILSVFASFAISVMVLMFGWGLEPHSWPWIFGGFTVQVFVLLALEIIKAANP